MRLLHIITGLSTGGAERALVRLIDSGDRTSFEHHVISLIDRGTQGGLLDKMGVPVYPLGMIGPTSFPMAVFKLRKIRQAIKPDIIHGGMYHGGLMALWTGSDTPKILGIRHSIYGLKNEKHLTRFIIRKLANKSEHFNAIIYNSKLSRKQHESLGYSIKNASVLPNGFDCKQFAPNEDKRRQCRKALAISDDVILFGHIARYHQIKNHHGLIEAFANLKGEKTSCKLLLIGRQVNSQNDKLTEHIRKLDLKDKVLLLGEQMDIPFLLNGMDYLVSPSLGEAFPNVIGEAMACGTPCIATDVGDSAFIIKDTGFLVPPGNQAKLSEALHKAADFNHKVSGNLGHKARQRILNHFQQEKITKEYEKVYLSMVGH